MRKLKKNYNRKNNNILSMSVCWCPCQGASCACWDAHTENSSNHQEIADNSRYYVQKANYE